MEYPHTKRFVVVWQHHGGNDGTAPPKSGWEDVAEFDTLAEAKEHVKFYKTYYPINGETRWGMVLLDYLTHTILWFGDETIWMPDRFNYAIKKPKDCWDSSKINNLKNLDMFFRKEGEIPENYKWDDGEYEGWLQYRWGDGKNAIDYRPPKTEYNTYENDDNNQDMWSCTEFEEAAWQFYDEPELKTTTLGDLFKNIKNS